MEILESEHYYHIYNHANGTENLFNCVENYSYFMQKYDLHISPVAETYSYCLMPNHFHTLIRIKDESRLIKSFPKFETLEKLQQNKFISKQFSNFFSSYTQSLNKKYNRKSSLFLKNFQRKKIISEQYLKQAIVYIHLNPVNHEFVERLEDWKFSSYNAFFSSKSTSIRKNEVINLFDDLSNFEDYHETKTAESYESKMGMTY